MTYQAIRYRVLEEIIHPYLVRNIPNTFSVIPAVISDPVFLKRKASLAWDVGNDHCFDLNYVGSFYLTK